MSKISGVALEQLRSAIEPYDTEETRARYRARNFNRADSVKDLDKRYRFDLFYAAHMPWDWSEQYTDAHIDTALRSVVPAL